MKEHHAYKSESSFADEVFVFEIKNGRVSYEEILTWSFGRPFTDGIRRSTTIKKFGEKYPHEIEWLEIG